MTIAHLLLVFSYTLSAVLFFNVKSTDGVDNPVTIYKVGTSMTFFGGVSELFLSCMLWFILDADQQNVIFIDEISQRTYAIL